MPELTLDEENLLARAGIADSNFADHSGNIQQGYELGSLTRGLVAYYPMEEGQGQVLHDGALDQLAQFNGATWSGTSNIGTASTSFDGSGQYITTFNSELFNNSVMTAAFWIRPNANTGEGELVDGITNAANQNNDRWEIKYDHDDESINWYNHGSTSTNIDGTAGTVPEGSWSFVVVIYDRPSTTMQIWVDGTLDTEDTSQSDYPINNTDPTYMGYRVGAVVDGYDGLIDSARFYNRRLSQPEIEALYNLGQPSGFLVEERDVPTLIKGARDKGGAKARYEFEGDVTDSWGDNDGTDNTSAGFVDGIFGQAKDFDDASNDRVELPNLNLNSSESFTVSLWANFDTVGGVYPVFGRTNGAEVISLNSNLNDAVAFQVGNPNQDRLLPVSADSIIEANNWYHLVGVYNSEESSASVLLDGSIVAYEQGAVSDFDTSDGPWIGARNDGTYSDVQIDDVRIYERALDPIEVETLYQLGAYRIPRGEI